MLPQTPTAVPKCEPAVPAVNVAVCRSFRHPPRGRTNTYATPCATSEPACAYGSPITIVVPEITSDPTNLAPGYATDRRAVGERGNDPSEARTYTNASGRRVSGPAMTITLRVVATLVPISPAV